MAFNNLFWLFLLQGQKEDQKVLSEEDRIIEEAKKLYEQNEMMTLYNLLVKYKVKFYILLNFIIIYISFLNKNEIIFNRIVIMMKYYGV